MDNYVPPPPVYINRFTGPKPGLPKVPIDSNHAVTSPSSGRGPGRRQESTSRGRNASTDTRGGGRGLVPGPLKPEQSHVLVKDNDINIDSAIRKGDRGQESACHGRNISFSMRGAGMDSGSPPLQRSTTHRRNAYANTRGGGRGSDSGRGAQGGQEERGKERGGRVRRSNTLESRAMNTRGRGEGGRNPYRARGRGPNPYRDPQSHIEDRSHNPHQARGQGFQLLTRGGDIRPISFGNEHPLASGPTLTTIPNHLSFLSSSQY